MQEMISFLNNNEVRINNIMFNPFLPLHYFLPLKLKFLPESYVLKDKDEIKGLITVSPSRCPQKKMKIQRLFFEENCYEDAAELIQFVVSKYKAMGTTSFIVKVDDYLPELIKLFIARCNFTQISYEKVWEIKNFELGNFNKKDYREFKSSDAPLVANLYNESLLPHFRTLLSKDAREFKEIVFKGLADFVEYRYVIENNKSKNINAYISIKSSDGINYILDIYKSSWVDLILDEIISFAFSQVSKRNKKFNLFIRTKKYTQTGQQDEQDFMDRGFECVQNQVLLTNSSARIIKEPNKVKKFTILNQFYGNCETNLS